MVEHLCHNTDLLFSNIATGITSSPTVTVSGDFLKYLASHNTLTHDSSANSLALGYESYIPVSTASPPHFAMLVILSCIVIPLSSLTILRNPAYLARYGSTVSLIGTTRSGIMP